MADHVCAVTSGAAAFPLAAAPHVRRTLRHGLFALLAALTDEDCQYLFTSLDPAARATFKSLYATYTKLHKFTGQV